MMRGPDVACCAKARGDTAMPAPTAVNIPRKLRRWYIRSPHFDSLSPSEPSRLMICLIASGIRQQSTPRSVKWRYGISTRDATSRHWCCQGTSGYVFNISLKLRKDGLRGAVGKTRVAHTVSAHWSLAADDRAAGERCSAAGARRTLRSGFLRRAERFRGDLEAVLAHVEALLAVEALKEFASGARDASREARCIRLYNRLHGRVIPVAIAKLHFKCLHDFCLPLSKFDPTAALVRAGTCPLSIEVRCRFFAEAFFFDFFGFLASTSAFRSEER